MILLLAVGVQSSLAWEIPPEIPGDYPGKWYGVYCDEIPQEKFVGFNDGTAFPNQTILNSWGYKAKPMEEIKDLVPATYYDICTHPQLWGDIRINETAFIPIDQWPGKHQKTRMAATERNKGKASIDEHGNIQGYINGFPFPGTNDATEMGWNYVKARNYGESLWTGYFTAIVDKKGHTKYSIAETTYFWWNGRLYGNENQHPFWKPNPNNYDLYNAMGWSAPYDLKGMVNLVHRYDSHKKQDDQWLYITSLRRVRRMSSSQRWDKLPGGNDITYDSATGFQGKPTNYEWKFLGRKLQLVGHNSKNTITEIKGKPAGTICDQWYQRVNIILLQFEPKIVSSVSRAVMFLDPETYACYYVEYFDKRGRPYMFYNHLWAVDGDGGIAPMGFFVADVQRIHSSNNLIYTIFQNDDAIKHKGIVPEYYQMDKLRAYYGGR